MDEPPQINLKQVADELGLTVEQVENVVALLDAGNTVPFITRYRKERTGNLTEEQIRAVQRLVTARRRVAERARTILRLIEAQGRLTPKLRRQIEQADSLKRLQDLYLPYRPKRKSRANEARRRGLEPLAERIWKGEVACEQLGEVARAFVSPQNDVPSPDDALQGAADILIERISDDSDVRQLVRHIIWRTGRLSVRAAKEDVRAVRGFENYVDYTEPLTRVPPHRILAVNRGERLGALRVKVEWCVDRAVEQTVRHYGFHKHPCHSFLRRCVADALQRSVAPSLEREVRRELTERAEDHAIQVFAKNLRNLLLQPPLPGQRVLAIDPGFRTGCKVAVLDECGQLLATDVVYVTGSQEKRLASAKKLAELLQSYDCRLIAIGNGTACRETEELVSLTIDRHCPDARYVIVNEAGASIYSTSPVAREEFPDYDATVRGTISIGRRLQDPLSELVKIEPQHLGVGLYQHDVNKSRLRESLNEVVESCVNYVGVDLNRASASLLRYVSGLNQLIARRIVEWRKAHGPFRNRRQLLEVPGIGDATFTQAAGFLKIVDGDEPLDSTWIHPESYEPAYKLLARLGISPEDWKSDVARREELRAKLEGLDKRRLAEELQVGFPTLCDIVDDLLRPGRDPRQDLAKPVFKKGVLKLDDVREGMELTGTVLNVVDFGVFVDIGLKNSALVHVSELSTHYVRSPHDVLSVGDVVTVWVLSVDREQQKVWLTRIPPGTPRGASTARARRGTSRTSTAGQTPSSSAAGNSNQTRSTDDDSVSPPPTTASPRRHARAPANRDGAGDGKALERPRPNRTTRRPAPQLSDAAIAGKEPLRSFSELKAFWEQRAH